jgi:hypothetical protein
MLSSKMGYSCRSRSSFLRSSISECRSRSSFCNSKSAFRRAVSRRGWGWAGYLFVRVACVTCQILSTQSKGRAGDDYSAATPPFIGHYSATIPPFLGGVTRLFSAAGAEPTRGETSLTSVTRGAAKRVSPTSRTRSSALKRSRSDPRTPLAYSVLAGPSSRGSGGAQRPVPSASGEWGLPAVVGLAPKRRD